MIKLISAFILSGASGFMLASILAGKPLPTAEPSAYQIIATDSRGESYVAGSGDDCATAWEGAELPADWRDIVCVPISR